MVRKVRTRLTSDGGSPWTRTLAATPGPSLNCEFRFRGRVLWWRSPRGEWRIVPVELWTCKGAEIAWHRCVYPPSFMPSVWDVVYAPLRLRGVVMAVRVIRATAANSGTELTVRGVTVEGCEVELSRARREVFADPIAAALELWRAPRLDAVVEFAS